MLTVAIPKRNKLQNIIVLTPKDGLRGAGIWHDWKVDDRQTHFLAPGKGTVRGSFGSTGVNLDITKEYKILVKEKDWDSVQSLLCQ